MYSNSNMNFLRLRRFFVRRLLSRSLPPSAPLLSSRPFRSPPFSPSPRYRAHLVFSAVTLFDLRWRSNRRQPPLSRGAVAHCHRHHALLAPHLCFDGQLRAQFVPLPLPAHIAIHLLVGVQRLALALILVQLRVRVRVQVQMRPVADIRLLQNRQFHLLSAGSPRRCHRHPHRYHQWRSLVVVAVHSLPFAKCASFGYFPCTRQSICFHPFGSH
mmetsp:Transcript_21139/g.33782  ORF Transcript_21139/g.33782 Transcript_21139/m.33782 type:complete len:214 (-) Transcript_21139:989-1630(-)